jgi:hypothetical protein
MKLLMRTAQYQLIQIMRIHQTSVTLILQMMYSKILLSMTKKNSQL